MSRKDDDWLRKELSQVLPDPEMASLLVDMLASVHDASDVNDLITNFAGDDARARARVEEFLAWRNKPVGSSTSTSSTSDASNLVIRAQVPSKAARNDAVASRYSEPSTSQAPATASADGKVLGMFKAGGKIKGPSAAARAAAAAAAGGGSSGAGGSSSSVPKGLADVSHSAALSRALLLERPSVNCLCCGKVYDCRGAAAVARMAVAGGAGQIAFAAAAAGLDREVLRFLEGEGRCLFCGTQVALPGAGQFAAEATASGASGGASDSSDATAAAVAYKNRLMGYQAESAKRTVVIDDQSDFFEVDSNAWLTDQERNAIKERAQAEAALLAERQRQRRVVVNIDLIGRKVMTADTDDANDQDRPSMRMARDELLLPAAKSPAVLAAAAGSSSMASAGAAGGWTAEDEVLASKRQMTTEQVKQKLHEMRAVINPNITIAAPVFKSHKPAAAAATGGRRVAPGGAATASSSAAAAPAAGSSAAGQGSSRSGAAVASTAAATGAVSQRLQTDLGGGDWDQFLDDTTDVGPYACVDRSPFDMCSPVSSTGVFAPLVGVKKAAAADSASPAGAPALPAPARKGGKLPDGLVLLKGWLTMDEQVAVVQAVRDLGVGHGGFYTPMHVSGNSLKLKLMCLGTHWEAMDSVYEDTRSRYDQAAPPAIPALLTDLCNRSLKDASTVASSSGTQLPAMKPDVCLCNFYDPRAGRLGMHQDKDEQRDTLRRGLPVVSFSVGDAADFVYSETHDEADGGVVRLESGDVLVFGGPARMVFHSVPRIYGGTAPEELLRRTNLRPGRLNLTFRQLRA